MKRGPNTFDLATRLAPAHLAVSGLALLAVIAVQANWDGWLGKTQATAWPSSAVFLIVAATAWLLSTTWLHSALARRALNRLALPPRRAALHAVADFSVAAIASGILWQGHASALAHAGLSTISPALVAIAVPSGLLLSAAVWAKPRVNGSSHHLHLARLGIAMALIIALALFAMPTSH